MNHNAPIVRLVIIALAEELLLREFAMLGIIVPQNQRQIKHFLVLRVIILLTLDLSLKLNVEVANQVFIA
jgi:hypothetical protein